MEVHCPSEFSRCGRSSQAERPHTATGFGKPRTSVLRDCNITRYFPRRTAKNPRPCCQILYSQLAQ
jgi:hypothetical protein